jgi:hypothetical protein
MRDKDKQRKHNAAYYAMHGEEMRAKHRAWREAHLEEVRAYQASYRAAHRDELLAKGRIRGTAYYAAHKEEVRAYAAAHAKERKARSLARYAARRDEYLASHRRQRYGMEPHDFEALRVSQGGRCAICSKLFTRTPNVDHDHVTGHVRGLLCQWCNTALGWFEKINGDWQERARDYLARHPGGVPCSTAF